MWQHTAAMPAPTSLCPGYRHVDEFDPNEEYESGEEAFYVTFDLGNIEPTLVPSSSTYRLIVSKL
jgi:general transcription factor 3C polypeptide 6